ncbi:hypothetical protein CGRA01v4_13538 [Colletotrichum graminicola]|nr:hypothetical protein CGRA01v4_13538 [Colletotrichum graminicola]
MAHERSQKRQTRTVFLICNGRHIRKGTWRPGTSSGFVCTTSVALWFPRSSRNYDGFLHCTEFTVWEHLSGCVVSRSVVVSVDA